MSGTFQTLEPKLETWNLKRQVLRGSRIYDTPYEFTLQKEEKCKVISPGCCSLRTSRLTQTRGKNCFLFCIWTTYKTMKVCELNRVGALPKEVRARGPTP